MRKQLTLLSHSQRPLTTGVPTGILLAGVTRQSTGLHGVDIGLRKKRRGSTEKSR